MGLETSMSCVMTVKRNLLILMSCNQRQDLFEADMQTVRLHCAS